MTGLSEGSSQAEADSAIASRTVPEDADELARLVQWYETRSALVADEFTHYFECEVALENILLQAATARAADLDLGGGRSVLEQVIDLNRTLSSAAQREMASVPDSDAETSDLLGTYRQLSDAMVLHLQGRIQESYAEESLQRGDAATALVFLGEARAYYVQLSQCPLANQSAFGARRVTESSLASTLIGAVSAMQAGQYQTAQAGFREARESYRVLLEDIEATQSEEPGALEDEFLLEMRDRHLYARVLYTFASFFVAVMAGDTDEAVVRAEHAISLGEDWLQVARRMGASTARVNTRAMELGVYRGWHSWILAEKAVDDARWPEFRDHVRQAREYWSESADVAMRASLRGIVTSGVDLGQLELLLQSTSRRAKREMSFLERLRQREQDSEALKTNIYVQGGTAVAGDNRTSSNFTFNNSSVTGAVGDGAQVHGGAFTSVSETSPAELRKIADELRTLGDQLAAGARSDAERDAVAEVRAAEEEARKGDAGGMRRHLKVAGKWAMVIAEKLLLPAAQSAISSSLGG